MTARGYVVGDLHLGCRDELEDFEQDDEFARFCERIAGPETTLMLNGDIIDFAQIPPFDVPRPAYLLWNEAASLVKLEAALAAHPGFFAGLRSFLGKGGSVRFIVGNHDLDMVWPKVQLRMWKALGEPATERLAYDMGAHLFHGVHVEHGFRFTPENCPRDPDAFCYPGPGGELHLERVWGTDFILQFYNDLERTHPYADNVKPMKTVVWAGLKKGWLGARTIVRLLLFLKDRGVSWKGLASKWLAEPPPLTATEAAAAFEDLAWQEAVLERASVDPDGFTAELDAAMAELQPEERRLAGAATTVDVEGPAQRGSPAAPVLGLFREERERRAARERLGLPGVTHVVFGHTHDVVDGNALDGDLKGRLFNYGTWLPSLNLKDAHIKAKIDRDGITLDLLKDSSLYTVERIAVRIDADAHYQATVRLVNDEEA
jgi:UDP-2,3-diacylglucosamine pyrophosphatase LpxH